MAVFVNDTGYPPTKTVVRDLHTDRHKVPETETFRCIVWKYDDPEVIRTAFPLLTTTVEETDLYRCRKTTRTRTRRAEPRPPFPLTETKDQW